MDPGFFKLMAMIASYLKSGTVWWNMPFVLILAFTFQHREQLMRTNLFDSYPDPLPKAKQRCNDPVLGACIFVLVVRIRAES